MQQAIKLNHFDTLQHMHLSRRKMKCGINTAMRTSAKPRRFTSCVTAPDATGRSSACCTSIFPSISQMAQSSESCVVASGAGCGLTVSFSFGVTLGIAIRTSLFGLTNSPDVFLPWQRRKIAPLSNQNLFVSFLFSVSHW